MRTVKTTSGAGAVELGWSSRRGSREIEHLGSAHDEAELEALKAAAQQHMAAGRLEVGLGLGRPGPSGPLPITSSRMSHLVDALERAYRVLGLQDAAGGDRVSWHLVLARIIEPASKLDSLRVLQDAGGVTAACYRNLKRRLPAYAASLAPDARLKELVGDPEGQRRHHEQRRSPPVAEGTQNTAEDD
jgi:hypothetical protein